MADQQVHTDPVEQAEKKQRFTLPSAYTILFALIVLMAIATWLVPAGVYDRDDEGAPVPGTYHEVDAEPAADPGRLAHRTDQRPVRDRGRSRQHQLLQLRGAVRCHRRRAVHHRHRRVPRHHHGDRGDPGRHQPAGPAAARQGTLDDPDPDGGLRPRRHHLRDGRGEPGLLRPGHHGADRRRLRRPDWRRRGPAGLRHRHPRVDPEPVRDRHRLRVRGHPDQRGTHRPPGHPGHRPGHRHLVRAALRRPGEAGPGVVGGPRHEGGERGPLPRDRGRGRCPGPDRHPQGDPGRLRAGLRRDDVRRDPLGGPRGSGCRRSGGGSRR